MVVRQAVLVVVVIVALGYAARAEAQVTLSHAANPASLGAIPDGLGSTCGVPRDVAFSVPNAQSLSISSLEVSMTVSHSGVRDLLVEVIDPSGHSFEIFSSTQPIGAFLEGTYRFSDAATGNWWGSAIAGQAIPPGNYRTSVPGGAVTAMNPAFAGRPSNGVWTLRFRDCFGADRGSVTAATLTITGAPLASTVAAPSTLGNIPDGPSATAQTPGPPRDVTFTIAPGRGGVRAVRVSTAMAHPRVGDLVALLIAPTGQSHVLFGYTGASNTGYGSSSALAPSLPSAAGYRFQDGPLLLDWWMVAEVNDPLIFGVYNTSALGGPGSTGAVTSMDTAFAGVPSHGVWTLRLTDGAAGAVGTIAGASLSLETDATPSTFADGYATPYLTPLTVAAPGLLTNDTDNMGGVVSAALVTGPSRGTVTLAPSGAFTYAPAAGFVGTDSFTYRATNTAGPGNVATVSITVAAPATVQPPTEFVTSTVAGNQVTLRWKAPAVGPAAADYVIEGGVAPGQVLGAVAVGGPLPIVSFPTPTGAFYLRVHGIDSAGQRSGPSNEIRVFVNTPAVPSAPTALTATANGNALSLSWGHSFAGGAPTGAQLDVTGSATASLPLSAAETLTLAGVPAGTYTFRVRATNDAGASAPSAPVTVTLPVSCSGAPAPPANVLAYAIGRTVYLVWDPPATGAAPASYVLHVGGSFTGTFPLATRNFSSPAPSGTYSLSLSAVNACGASTQTAPQTVFVP